MLNILSAAIGTTWELPFEIPYILWLQNLSGKGSFLYYLMNFISMFGEDLILVGILGLLYWGIDKNRGKKIGIFLFTATLSNSMIKNIACRTRPFDAHTEVQNFRDVDGYSFPSGHSSSAASVYFGSAVVYKDKKRKWLWIVGSIIPVLVAISRNYLGAHYPTDVLAGLALGVIIVFLLNWLINIVPNVYYIYGAILIVGLAGFFYCTTSDFFTAYGITLGFVCGILLEEKKVNFKNTKVWWRIVLRVVVGGALFLALNEVLKVVVGLFADKVVVDGESVYWFDDGNHFWFTSIFRVLRYAIVVFLLMGVYPMLFAQTEKLWKKLGWIKADADKATATNTDGAETTTTNIDSNETSETANTASDQTAETQSTDTQTTQNDN